MKKFILPFAIILSTAATAFAQPSAEERSPKFISPISPKEVKLQEESLPNLRPVAVSNQSFHPVKAWKLRFYYTSTQTGTTKIKTV